LPAEVLREVERSLPSNLPDDEKQKVVQQLVATIRAHTYQYIGHIPPPDLVHGWEKILPGSAHRMLTMSEDELAAGIARDKDVRSRDDRFRHVTMIYGALIILFLFIFAFAALREGYPWVAAAFLGAGVASTLASFFRLTNGLAHGEAAQADPSPASPTKPVRKRSKR
jgi:uncharacterized membrane protein